MERSLNSDISIACFPLNLINVVKNLYNSLYCDDLRTCVLNIIVPFLIACFNFCVLSFASEIANLLIAFAFFKGRKVRYKKDTIAFPIIVNTIETRNSQ